jgi:hypothetical protein
MNSSSETARAALRREHSVRIVMPNEEGVAAEHLPDGVYGFTSSPALASPLFGVRRYRNFEIHRLPNGVAAVVGFVTPADAAELTRASSTASTQYAMPPRLRCRSDLPRRLPTCSRASPPIWAFPPLGTPHSTLRSRTDSALGLVLRPRTRTPHSGLRNFDGYIACTF